MPGFVIFLCVFNLFIFAFLKSTDGSFIVKIPLIFQVLDVIIVLLKTGSKAFKD